MTDLQWAMFLEHIPHWPLRPVCWLIGHVWETTSARGHLRICGRCWLEQEDNS